MAEIRRLVVCLDGTWDNRDDTTNVLHHHSLARDAEHGGVANQIKYYHEGVGTGVLDGITGGAFGFGLEGNVRAAYDWLVAEYNDENGPDSADQIYIFGFSRGAYTARSLVGFIATCGLLRRGSPLSVSELWEDYCILGRKRENRTSFWDNVFGETPTNIRRINDLICDPWNIVKCEQARAKKLADNIAATTAGAGHVKGQLVDDLNIAERLLVRWSRRVRITYLGIYDTVGAMGIDALAIPGVKSKLAMHHNMRATTLIQYCRHALAIDEHRGSFSHTPFIEYVGHGVDQDDNQRSAIKEGDTEAHWRHQHAMWRRKIEQRWFVGAHSNIGGGYPDNELAQRPLEWLLEGARASGLQCELFNYLPPMPMPQPRDSFEEFLKPFWTQIIRAKRYYRPIDPEPAINAAPPAKARGKDNQPVGFTLRSINEQVDNSVFLKVDASNNYRPSNLVNYARRKLEKAPLLPNADQLRSLATEEPRHVWAVGTAWGYLSAVLWSTFAGVGLLAVNELFCVREDSPLPLWLICAAAFAFVLIDWGESRANFALAIGPWTPRWRAFLESVYWMRTLGFLLFTFGATATLAHLWGAGWHADTVQSAWTSAIETIKDWWSVPVAAGAGTMVADVLTKNTTKRSALLGAVIGIVVTSCAVPLVTGLGWLFGQVFTPLFGHRYAATRALPPEAQRAGLLLLLQLGYVLFLRALSWVGEPSTKANLGSITALQRRFSSRGVAECLERWRRMLACHWSKDDADTTDGPAARAMRRILSEGLWRDIFGFIPVYFVLFAFGLWFAATEIHWNVLNEVYVGIPIWLLLPLVAAVADYCEDFCHLRYIALHARGAKPSTVLALISFAMTLMKFAAFIPASLLTVAAIAAGSWQIAMMGEKTGWRGTVALLISALTALSLIIIVLSATVYRIQRRMTRR